MHATINDLRAADWIYPAAGDGSTWHEISEEHWDHFLNVLPPIYKPLGFMLCEAARHDGDGIPVRAYFVRTRAGRYFVREVRETETSEAVRELEAALLP